MEKLVRIGLAALFLLGIASAQNLPEIDLFGGYSYLSFALPASPGTGTPSERLALNGWDVSASVHLFRHLAAEADFSGHNVSDCNSVSGVNCNDLSYMFGPRLWFATGSGRITGFVHGLVGRDNGTFEYNGISQTDTSTAVAAGGGVDYWLFRHIGVQAGPFDFFHTNHLNAYDVSSQNSYRVAGGVVFRFGGESSSSEPSPKPRRAPAPNQPSTVPARQTAAPSVGLPGGGMSVPALGVVVAPQEFDGAKVLQIVPGGVAEMASLRVGDLIRSVDGRTVKTPMELAAELSDKSGKVRIGILRGDVAVETLVLLGR